MVIYAKYDHEKFWRLSWYEVALLTDQYVNSSREKRAKEEAKWARFRISWADFRNVNRSKKGKVVYPTDLIKLSFDTDRKAEYHEIDMDAVKRMLGSKIKKKNGKK